MHDVRYSTYKGNYNVWKCILYYEKSKVQSVTFFMRHTICTQAVQFVYMHRLFNYCTDVQVE